MLYLTVKGRELYDSEHNRFIDVKTQTIQLEHSLVSISKWEARWKKPFLSNKTMTVEETVDYITTVLKRLTVVGAFALSIIAALPIIFGMISGLPSSVTIGGTGLLIVVGVALETYKQLESQLVSRTYKKGRHR